MRSNVTPAEATLVSATPVQIPASHVTSAGPTRQLQDLTTAELCVLLERTGLEKVATVFAEKEVTGVMLSFYEESAQLLASDFGLTSETIAKGLLKLVHGWVEHGVPGVWNIKRDMRMPLPRVKSCLSIGSMSALIRSF